MVLLATPNQASSGKTRAWSTLTIENDLIALMQCPSVLSAPTSMGHFYSLNAIAAATHDEEEDVVLAATPNHASAGQLQGCLKLVGE